MNNERLSQLLDAVIADCLFLDSQVRHDKPVPAALASEAIRDLEALAAFLTAQGGVN